MLIEDFQKKIAKWTGLLATCLIVSVMTGTQPASAERDISREISQKGIVATRDRLRAAKTLTDGDKFALGGLEMLSAVEDALQARWRIGLSRDLEWLPLMRLTIPDNEQPEKFDPAVIAQIFRGAVKGSVAADATLSRISDASDFKLEIDAADIWFDVNANHQRDPGESFAEVTGLVLSPEIQKLVNPDAEPSVPSMIIRFDLADAHWLKAYANLIAGIGETILAYDPTEAIADVYRSRTELARLGMTRPSEMFDFVGIADMVTIVRNALDQQPDKAALARAHGHFLSMIRENRVFWRLVGKETDNDAEWIPNAHQTSALGIEFPPQTAEVWQTVLADAEALLEGRLLAPYWQLDSSAGVNVKRMFLDPKPVDLLNWIQGQDALNYIENGPTISFASWRAFEDMVMGDAILYALILN